MSSAAQEMKQRLLDLSRKADALAQSLMGIKGKFPEVMAQTMSAAQGTSTHNDVKINEILSAAAKQVDGAIQTLHSASNAAKQFANQV